MPDHLKKSVLLVGAGPMAVDHYRVLEALGCSVTVIGRGAESANSFEEKTGKAVIVGGLTVFLKEKNVSDFDAAIVSVGMEQLAANTAELIQAGIQHILVEKPAGLNRTELENLSALAEQKGATVYVAYNRRHYASVLKAKEIIAAEGGVSSFNFEFTEWAHVIEPLHKAPGVKEQWLLGNSTHVIDMAFYLGGLPQSIHCLSAGSLSWHPKSSFAGAGKSKNGALFSYQANWDAPGRWGVEVLTSQSRLIFRPLEELKIQRKGSIAIESIELDTTLDKAYKPGLYVQSELFLSNQTETLVSIAEQAGMAALCEQILNGND